MHKLPSKSSVRPLPAFNQPQPTIKVRPMPSTMRTEATPLWPPVTIRRPCMTSELRLDSMIKTHSITPIEATAWWCSTKSTTRLQSSKKLSASNPTMDSTTSIEDWSMQGWWTLPTPSKTSLKGSSTSKLERQTSRLCSTEEIVIDRSSNTRNPLLTSPKLVRRWKMTPLRKTTSASAISKTSSTT